MARVAKTKGNSEKKARDAVKYEALIRMRSSNQMSKASAADYAGVTERTARRWAKSGPPKKAGRRPIDKAPRASQMEAFANEAMEKGGKVVPRFPTAARIAAAMLKKYGFKRSRYTVRRYLKDVGMVSRIRPRHPGLSNVEKRLTFAKIWQHKNPDFNVFSDEHFVSINDNTVNRMYVKKGTSPLPRSVKRMQNVSRFHIWAAVGVGFKSKIIIFPQHKPKERGQKGPPKAYRLTSEDYIGRCLSNPGVKKKITKRNIVFMQDGAGPHRAQSITQWFHRNGAKVMKDFPAHSPDLNPIECVWSELNVLPR